MARKGGKGGRKKRSTSSTTRRKRTTAVWGVWWKKGRKVRNTPDVKRAGSRAEAIKKSRAGGTTGSNGGTVVSARKLTGSALKAALAGRWVRERPNGAKNSSAGNYGFRPQLKKKARGRKVT